MSLGGFLADIVRGVWRYWMDALYYAHIKDL